MAAILHDSTMVAIAVVHTHPRATPLAMITTRISIHGFLLVSYMGMRLRLAAQLHYHYHYHYNYQDLSHSLLRTSVSQHMHAYIKLLSWTSIS